MIMCSIYTKILQTCAMFQFIFIYHDIFRPLGNYNGMAMCGINYFTECVYMIAHYQKAFGFWKQNANIKTSSTV